MAIISASPVIGNIFTTMDSNDGDSMHSEGSGPLNKLHPSGSPTGVLDSTDLQMDIHQTSHSISVPQLASVAHHNKLRALWDEVMPEPFNREWCLQRCAWNSTYFELAEHYPDSFGLIGSGTQEQVKLLSASLHSGIGTELVKGYKNAGTLQGQTHIQTWLLLFLAARGLKMLSATTHMVPDIQQAWWGVGGAKITPK
ncbi:hypothetical protein ABBQ38_001380 [Trebouxia sp. C0009 RCD-2024]